MVSRFFKFSLPVVLGVGLWQITSTLIGSNYFPALNIVFSELFSLVRLSSFWIQISLTLIVLLASLTISYLVSAAIYFALLYISTLEEFLKPILNFLRAIPTIVIFPLLAVIMGISLKTEIFVISLGTTLKFLLFMQESKVSVSKDLHSFAKVSGFNMITEYLYIRLPASISSTIVGLRYVSSVALGTIVALGILVGAPGLGQGLYLAENSGDTPKVFAYVLAMGIAGILLNFIIGLLQNILKPYSMAGRS